MGWKIPLFKIYSDKQDIKMVSNIIASGMYWAEGLAIREFEDKIASYLGVKHCVVFNSGTSALHAALIACGVKENDEVIVPSFTFIATSNAPLFVGAKPVFADIEDKTFGLDPEDVERKITARTKAIIPVHYGGLPCQIGKLRKIADKYKLKLIEDAAESLGAKIGGRKVATFGEVNVLSFCQNKIIATGEGGAAVTNSSNIYERLKLIKSHGRSDVKNYFSSVDSSDYIDLGYNFRMPTFVAALGLAQLNKINKIIEMRRSAAEYYARRLKEIPRIKLQPPLKDCFHVYQLYVIRVTANDRGALMKYLAGKGVMTKIYFLPVHSSSFYKNKLKYRCKLPVTENIAREILALPIYPNIKNKDIDYIIENIKKFFKERK